MSITLVSFCRRTFAVYWRRGSTDGTLLSMQRHRFIFLSAAVILSGSGLAGLACSSPDPVFTADAGPDATSFTDSGKDSTPPGDGAVKDGGGGDGAIVTCTSPVTGECDIVAQNCTGGNECVLVAAPDGGTATACAAPGNGAIPKGGVCTSSGNNPCIKGTTCVSGRCAPACCDGADSICGSSIPEGFSGQCALDLVDKDNKPLYRVCTYNAVCKPFGVQACPKDYACIVKDQQGTSSCTTIFPPPGKTEGQACNLANDCQDGMMCLGPADGGACKFVCYKGGGPYFDGGTVTTPSGKGGCTGPKTCNGAITGLPSWLGICQ